jgi:methyl-accepting chemotaxis protein
MTPADGCLLGLAMVDVLAIGGMAMVGLRFKATADHATRQMKPALQEALALAGTGKAMADQAQKDGKAMAARVTGLTAKLKQRIATTKRVVRELKPASQDAAAAVQETAGDVRQKQAQVVGTTLRLTDIGRRLARVRSAAEAAAQAASRERAPGS